MENINRNGAVTGIQSGLCLDANGAPTANGTRTRTPLLGRSTLAATWENVSEHVAGASGY